MCRQCTSRVQLTYLPSKSRNDQTSTGVRLRNFRPHLRKIPHSVLNRARARVTHYNVYLGRSAPSPVESLPPAPSCAGWTFRMAFHGRMKCHVTSHQVKKCFSHPVVHFAPNCCHSRSSLLSLLSSPKLRRANMIHSEFA